MEQDESMLVAGVSRRVMVLRLLTGLAQGMLLYGLYQAVTQGWWPASAPSVLTPAILAATLLPALLVSSMGHMAPAKVVRWLLVAAGVLLLLALHAVGREAGLEPALPKSGSAQLHALAGPLPVAAAIWLFIAHALVMAGAAEQRWLASYDSYFESAWKLAVQLLFSVFFVATLWLVLLMGSGLFAMVQLTFFKQMMTESWFVAPVVCFAWSCAMHLTDVRPAIVRGIRSLLLMLLSWILPVAALIVSGFLCTLPFTGLSALWATNHAALLLLAADLVLVVLINAAFQNGHAKAVLAIRVSARVASLLILPLTAIAIYALGLRVHDYGWTAGRVLAAASMVVASCYALGYAWAAQRYETWLYPITRVNQVAALVLLLVLLAVFTPIADPARLAVNSQVARLAQGRIKASQFDFHYLRFDGQRYGQQALARLAQQTSGAEAALIRERAALALKAASHWQAGVPTQLETPSAPVSIADNVKVWPATARLPASFLAQQWSAPGGGQPDRCLVASGQHCDALVIDVDGDGKPEVLLFNGGANGGGNSTPTLYARQANGLWKVAGHFDAGQSACQPLIDRLKAGQYALVTPPIKALAVAGQVLQFQSEFDHQQCQLIKAARPD